MSLWFKRLDAPKAPIPGYASTMSSAPFIPAPAFSSLIVTSCASILSGAVYARHGQGVYYVMAAMALLGAVVMWLARRRLADHPHSAASGG